MKVRILSIPHTGTTFTHQMLEANGVEIEMTSHVTENEDWSGHHIICPLRHPSKVAQSWSNRGLHYKHFSNGAADRKSTDGWTWSWDELKSYKDRYQAHYFNLEQKDAALAKLSKYLGVPLETDWTPVNHVDKGMIRPIPQELIDYAIKIYNKLTYGEHRKHMPWPTHPSQKAQRRAYGLGSRVA